MSTQTEPTQRYFTGAEVLRMVEVGILDEDEPVELIDGRLIIMSPQGPSHRTVVVIIRRLLEAAYGEAAHSQDHSNIEADRYSLPEPDVAVVRGQPRDYLDHLPRPDELLLVVEVSVTTRREDLAKAALYARWGVPVYWRVDVRERVIEVYEQPAPDGGWAKVVTLAEGDTISPPGTEAAWRVAEMLP